MDEFIHNFYITLSNSLSKEAVLKENEPLATKTTLGVGGAAALYLEPACLEDLQLAFAQATVAKIPIFILGRGSNTLVLDHGYSGLVIRLNKPYWRAIKPLNDTSIQIGAGSRLKEISSFACKMGLSGFEFMEGIPGTLGGALLMNAGAMGSWMSNLVAQVTVLSEDGTVLQLSKKDCGFAYRQSGLKNSIILEAILSSFIKKEPGYIEETMQAYSIKRKNTQPKEASAGCAFKNPKQDSAGRLVDFIGLKGIKVGQAQISNIHANFLINTGEAKAADVIELVKQTHKTVMQKTNTYLEPEIIIMGDNWANILKEPS